MKRIGCLTFHAAHNYGSCLQAYALQTAVQECTSSNLEYKVINYRTENQKKKYLCIFDKKDLKSIYTSLFFLKGKMILRKSGQNLRISFLMN